MKLKKDMSKMIVRFTHTAEEELDETIEYYEYQISGLGIRFFEEISRTIDRIIKFPRAWTKIGRYTRRCLLKKFPYAIFYTIEEDDILILAVANMHRNPELYKNRIR